MLRNNTVLQINKLAISILALLLLSLVSSCLNGLRVVAVSDQLPGLIEEEPISGGAEKAEEYRESLKSYNPSPSVQPNADGVSEPESASAPNSDSNSLSDPLAVQKQNDKESGRNLLITSVMALPIIIAIGLLVYLNRGRLFKQNKRSRKR